MSCWVVPSIAADFWGIPLQQVLDNIRAGRVASKAESGFTFVDVAPESPVMRTGVKRSTTPPPTYTTVTREEIRALVGDEAGPDTAFGEDEGATEDSIDLGDWRSARQEAGRTRRPPIAA